MNESLRLTALFVRDLLGYNEQLIRIGRQNYDIDDFTVGYIGVDSLGAAADIGTLRIDTAQIELRTERGLVIEP
jgi:hypothetical protein